MSLWMERNDKKFYIWTETIDLDASEAQLNQVSALEARSYIKKRRA
jgi:hypothetical protein